MAEKNFGGAMAESTLRTAWRTAPIGLLNASGGKVQRFVAAGYDEGVQVSIELPGVHPPGFSSKHLIR